MTLEEIDKQIYNCNLCEGMVEKFTNSKTVSISLKSYNGNVEIFENIKKYIGKI